MKLPNRKQLKQWIAVNKITQIIAKHTNLPDDAEEVIEAAEEIYELLKGKLVKRRLDP